MISNFFWWLYMFHRCCYIVQLRVWRKRPFTIWEQLTKIIEGGGLRSCLENRSTRIYNYRVLEVCNYSVTYFCRSAICTMINHMPTTFHHLLISNFFWRLYILPRCCYITQLRGCLKKATLYNVESQVFMRITTKNVLWVMVWSRILKFISLEISNSRS